MTAERTGDHDTDEELPALERPPRGEAVRETTVEGGELLLWSADSEGAWIQTDAVVTLPDQKDPIER